MKSLLLIGILCFTAFACVHGQMYVQLEKAGTLNTVRYSPGDMLTFALRNDESGWHTRMIQSLDIPGNRIIFPDVVVHVDSIAMIRRDRKALGAQLIGGALQVGGINVMSFTAYEAIFRDADLEWGAMAAGLLNVAVGTGIKRLFRKKVFRVGPWKRIRLLDLNFMNAPNQP